MAPTRAWSSPKSTGEQVSAAEFNALDDGQFAALVRNGSAALTATSTIDMGSGALDLVITGAGTGRFKPVADKTKFTGTGWPEMDSRSVTSWVPPAAPVCLDVDYAPLTLVGLYLQQLQASKVLAFWLTLPVGTVVTAISVPVQKPAAAAFPGVLASINFGYVTLSTGASTSLGSQADPSGSEAAYEAHHLITLSGLNHTVATGRRYLVLITGDNNSTGTSDGLLVYSPMVDLTVTGLRTV